MSVDLISQGLCFAPEHLKKIEVAAIPDNDFDLFKYRIIPSFCYDNSFITATELDEAYIVYGAAVVQMGNNKLPVEHCWVKRHDNTYVDPTYQVLSEKLDSLNAEYYVLFELTIEEYLTIAEKERGVEILSLCALDFTSFRRNQEFRHYFYQA